jgi:excisionase family DNA binding protein
MTEQSLTLKEAAAQAQVSVSTARRLIAMGAFVPHYRLSGLDTGHLRFRAQDVAAWIAKRNAGGAA